jgi:excisionase family DNA binding protein
MNDHFDPSIEKLISLSEASEFSGLSSDHLRRLAEQNKLKALKIGRNWITSREAIEDYLKQRNPPGRPKKLFK